MPRLAMAPRSPRSPRAGARANLAALAGVMGAAQVVHRHGRLWPTLVAKVVSQMRSQQAAGAAQASAGGTAPGGRTLS